MTDHEKRLTAIYAAAMEGHPNAERLRIALDAAKALEAARTVDDDEKKPIGFRNGGGA